MLCRVKSLKELRSAERQAFLLTPVLLPIVSLMVKLFGVRRAVSLLSVRNPHGYASSSPDAGRIIQAERTAKVFHKALYCSPFRAACLSRSLVLWHLLQRQGLMGEICIGVQKDEQNQPFGPGNFSAHAWVEYDGMALNDRPDVREHYVVFEHLSLQN